MYETTRIRALQKLGQTGTGNDKKLDWAFYVAVKISF